MGVTVATTIFIIVLMGPMVPSLALDMTGCKEGSCFATTSTFLDLNWLTQHRLYYPMMSRYYLYNLITSISPGIDPTKIIEGSIYYDACLRFQAYNGGSQSIITGYLGAREQSFSYASLDRADGGTAFASTGNGPSWNGTLWTSMTDNETYVLITLCDGDGYKMWKLMSTTPTVCDKIKQQVLKKLYELGFKEEYFTEMRYDTCKCQQAEYAYPPQ